MERRICEVTGEEYIGFDQGELDAIYREEDKKFYNHPCVLCEARTQMHDDCFGHALCADCTNRPEAAYISTMDGHGNVVWDGALCNAFDLSDELTRLLRTCDRVTTKEVTEMPNLGKVLTRTWERGGAVIAVGVFIASERTCLIDFVRNPRNLDRIDFRTGEHNDVLECLLWEAIP